MTQPGTRVFPKSDPCGIDVEDDGFIVDLALLARLLDVPASDVQALMREGCITSLCEKGVGEHTDQFRLTFFHGNRRASVRIDPSGRILTRSIVDYGSKAASRLAHYPLTTSFEVGTIISSMDAHCGCPTGAGARPDTRFVSTTRDRASRK